MSGPTYMDPEGFTTQFMRAVIDCTIIVSVMCPDVEKLQIFNLAYDTYTDGMTDPEFVQAVIGQLAEITPPKIVNAT